MNACDWRMERSFCTSTSWSVKQGAFATSVPPIALLIRASVLQVSIIVTEDMCTAQKSVCKVISISTTDG